MVFRASAVTEVRFDENLPLYAWLEDSDYSHAATRGRLGPVTNLQAFGVHLGSRGGRVAGRRLGFSQMVNPFYLWRKSRVFSLPFLAVHYWARCIVGNLLGLVSGEKVEDRKGRLIGNLHGIAHLLRGRACPLEALRIASENPLTVEPDSRAPRAAHKHGNKTEQPVPLEAEGGRR